MMFRPVFALFVLLAVVGDAGAARLRVATYNVENYGPADRMTAEGYRENYPKPESEKTALRAVIRALDADVLVLQEMGPRPYFEELRRDLKAEGCDYPHGILLEGPDAERHVALLSRRPLTSVVPHVALSFPYLGGSATVKRGMLEATIATPAGDVTLFALHLKSRFTDRADDPMSAERRAGEAAAIRDLILRRLPEPGRSLFLILGDCNDGRTSRTLQRLQGRGRREVAQLLPAADRNGESWTHWYRKEELYSRVDHILVSAALRAYVADSRARICDVPAVTEASDHRPVYVDLPFPEP